MSARYHKGDEPVPGYTLECHLGSGGFGEVWKANAAGGTEAAIKIISLSGKQGLKEFRALRLVKRIRHPNLVPIYAYWLKDDAGRVLQDVETHFDEIARKTTAPLPIDGSGTLKVEMRDGPKPRELIIAMGLGEHDLSKRLDQCRQEGFSGIPPKELLEYVEDAARAIDYLNSPRHTMGAESIAIQHCDIKPFNILIVGGAAQVCDLGLARIQGDVRKTATTSGTVAYMAPECMTENEPSSASDQYSLAITYIELRTGRLPYASEVFTDVVNAVREGKLDFSYLSEAERVILRRATALAPKDRYPTAMEMVRDLRRAVDQPNLVSTIDLGTRVHSGGGHGWLKFFVFLVAAGGVVWGIWQYADEIRESSRALLERFKSAQVVDQQSEHATTIEPKINVEPKITTTPAATTSANTAATNTQSTGPQLTSTTSISTNGTNTATTSTKLVPETKQPPELSDAAARRAIGRAADFMDKGQFADALGVLDTTIREAPRPLAEAFLLRGTCQLEADNYKQAIVDLSRAIELDPADVRGYSRRGNAYFRQGDEQRAIEDFTTSINKSPDTRDYLSRAMVYWNLEKHDLAIADLSEALRFDPESADALFKRGLVHFDARHWTEANRDFAAALEHAPDDSEVQLNYARLLAMAPDKSLRNGERALSLATRAATDSPEKTADMLDVLAASQAEAGRFEDAQTTIARAIELEADPAMKERYRGRQKLYLSNQPFHLTP